MSCSEAASKEKAFSIEINELLQVRVQDDQNSVTCPSRVDDLVDGSVVISWPTDAGVRLPIREGQTLALYFVRRDAAYLFHAVVEQRKRLPIPQLVLGLTGAAQRIQRRQYFRVKASMSVELSGTVRDEGGENEEFIRVRTRTHDVSGSGIAIRHNSRIPPGTRLDTKLVLPGELPAVKAVSKVVHSATIPSDRIVYHIGMYFLTISESDRSRIIRHLFRIQQSLLS